MKEFYGKNIDNMKRKEGINPYRTIFQSFDPSSGLQTEVSAIETSLGVLLHVKMISTREGKISNLSQTESFLPEMKLEACSDGVDTYYKLVSWSDDDF